MNPELTAAHDAADNEAAAHISSAPKTSASLSNDPISELENKGVVFPSYFHEFNFKVYLLHFSLEFRCNRGSESSG